MKITKVLKKKWCNWFHNCLRLPDEKWEKLICPKCKSEFSNDYFLASQKKGI